MFKDWLLVWNQQHMDASSSLYHWWFLAVQRAWWLGGSDALTLHWCRAEISFFLGWCNKFNFTRGGWGQVSLSPAAPESFKTFVTWARIVTDFSNEEGSCPTMQLIPSAPSSETSAEADGMSHRGCKQPMWVTQLTRQTANNTPALPKNMLLQIHC